MTNYPRRFVLERKVDVSGVSGTGVVCEGVEFSDGVVALRWVGKTPTSVVFHDNGIESVEAVHGHGGNTQIVWLDEVAGPEPTNIFNPVFNILGVSAEDVKKSFEAAVKLYGKKLS